MSLTTIDRRVALVLIDLQQGIVAGPVEPRPATDVLANCVTLADAFRANGSPVILVRVTFDADGANAVPGRTEVSLQQSQAPRPANWDVLVPEIASDPKDIHVTKRNWGAFYGTDLDLQLRRRGVTQIVLGGISTSVGVESTARSAHEHGYNLTFATDAMGDRSAAAHDYSIENIFPRLGERGTTAEVLALYAATRG